MSKKKSMSTMSLKDFHGGSIPSDLPLPSAPGVMKPGSGSSISGKGNNLVNSDVRTRPKSSGAHDLDQKASLLSHPLPIGRHFDEDERKPLNGVSPPRQTINNEGMVKQSNVASARLYDNPVSSPSLVNSSSSTSKKEGSNPFVINSHTRVVGDAHGASNGIRLGLNIGQRVNNQPNAWGMRKEVTAVEKTAKPPLLSGADASLKIAQASALEKVSSGMWQSKKPSQLLPHLRYSRDHENNVSADRVGDEVAEHGPHVGGKESPKMYMEEMHTKATGVESLEAAAPPAETSERPKLKLLPRSVLPEISEDNRQGYWHPTVAGKSESVDELYQKADSLIPDAAAETAVERPKLNLKPRSQPLGRSDGSLERERQAVFGGARPRELVLKERGTDETVITDSNRINSPKNETTSRRMIPSTQQNQNPPNLAQDKRVWRGSDQKEPPHIQQWKDDNQGKSRRDQRPEPETWRKPIDEPKPASHDASGIPHGKAVSALELAQAFSKSVSGPKAPEQYSTGRRLPGAGGYNKMPFSRLTDTGDVKPVPSRSTRHRINGY